MGSSYSILIMEANPAIVLLLIAKLRYIHLAVKKHHTDIDNDM